jgi:hypothetical protein
MDEQAQSQERRTHWIVWLAPATLVAIVIIASLAYGISAFIWFILNPLKYVQGVYQGALQGFYDTSYSYKMASLAAVSAILLVIGTSALAIATIILHAHLLRRRHPIVFISYKHAKMGHLLPDIATAFERGGLVASFVPFKPKADRDEIIDEVEDRIRQCDVVVCLPGDEPSWVESEVASAGAQRKPLILVLPRENNGAPDSASRQYPALILELLAARDYAPLVDFIGYVHGNARWTWRLIRMETNPGRWILVLIVPMILFLGFSLVSALVLSLLQLSSSSCLLDFACHAFVRGYLVGQMAYAYLVLALVLLLVLVIAGPLRALLNRLKAARVVRREIRTGQYSYTHLKELFEQTDELKPLLGVFWRVAPRAHHERR